MPRRITLACAALIALAGCGGQSTAQQSTRADSSAADSARPDPLASRTKGSATAPITVYEMSDFQCPFCRRHALEAFPVLEQEYVRTGKVRWVFINMPLTSIHPNAEPAARFSVCAARHGKFWPAHDLLFEHQEAWSRLDEAGPFLLSLADSIGAPRDSILACLESPEAAQQVRADAEGALRAGATSTPTFYIEGGLLVGAQPPEVFRQILDSIYTAKTAPKP